MVTVLHVPTFVDNYVWLLRRGDHVAIVDPGDAKPVMRALERERLHPVAVLATHHHGDHVGGIDELRRRYDVPVFGPARESIPGISRGLDEGDVVDIEDLGLRFDILATPGHTLGHIAYHGAGMLFCGDTLFSAGCGRLFEGTAEQLHHSLSRLAALPDDTRVYCGHEYTAANLRFARTVEPDNPDILAHASHVSELRARSTPSLPSTIHTEKQINPFFRVHIDAVRRAAAAQASRSVNLDTEVFAILRRWKDGFRG